MIAVLPENCNGSKHSGRRFRAGGRAIKTVAQTAIDIIGTAAVMGDVNWSAGLPEVKE